MINITVIGTGYVGLTFAVGLADFGHRVTGCDLDEKKIARLQQGECPIFELGLPEYLQRNLANGNLSFTTDSARAVSNSEVVFLAVGTPSAADGSVDTGALSAAAKTVAENLNGYTVVVVKSTVPIGANRVLGEQIKRQRPGADFDLVANPEFLREGKAVQDFFHPDRVVIGCRSERARQVMESVYRPLNLISTPFCWCGPETAEVIKYASNAFLATKIAFINEMANLCSAVDADVHDVARAMGMDGRISPKFLHPGPGFGGSCFPKDIKALAFTGRQKSAPLRLIEQVIDSNERQKALVAGIFAEWLGGLAGKTITVFGLAFKAETDDVRDSPALLIIEKLLEQKAVIKAHDPQACDNFRLEFPQIDYREDKYEALAQSQGLLILTEWNEYRSLDLEKAAKAMAAKVIFDCRNVLDPVVARGHGFAYKAIGRS